jgi:glycerophosphoryl diester phosphodiesterase
MRKNKLLKITYLPVVLILIYLLYFTGIYRWIDINVFGEKLKDLTGQYIFNENWNGSQTLQDEYDYRWIEKEKYLFISHALGGSGSVEQNTIKAYEKGVKKGFYFFEIDIWLDEQGILICHHGPDRPRKFIQGDCSLGDILARDNGRSWFILDIKTDFTKTALEVSKLLTQKKFKNVIFQLYKPEHIEIFNNISKINNLPGPIVTLYLTRRSVEHIIKNIKKTNIRIVTLPEYRLNASNKTDLSGLKILSHPTHTCYQYNYQISKGVTGFYVTNNLFENKKNINSDVCPK